MHYIWLVFSTSMYRKPSTAKRNQPCTNEESVCPNQSATTQGDTELARGCMSSGFSTGCCLRKPIEEIEVSSATTYFYFTAVEAGMTHDALGFTSSFSNITQYSFSPTFRCISYAHRVSWSLSWTIELLDKQDAHLLLKSSTSLSASSPNCSLFFEHALHR